MSSAYVDAVADRFGTDAATFASLSLPLAHRIFLALPADARGRASCVCRAWRDALADPSLWMRLDMSVVRVRFQRFADVLQGAAGRACGELRQLDLSQHDASIDELLPVLTANAGSLSELHLSDVRARLGYDEDECLTVEAVTAAAPLLQVLTAEAVSCSWEDAPQMLRTKPPFQMRGLKVYFSSPGSRVGGMERFCPFVSALADVTLQPTLLGLYIDGVDTEQPALVGALVDAALARRLPELCLEDCTPPAAAPLARLLAGSLVRLELDPIGGPLFDAAGAELVADALRVNTALTALELYYADLSLDVRGVAEVLLGPLVGHLNLRELRIAHERTKEDDRSAFGAALAALIAADAPALHVFNCSANSLGDAGLAPIVEALALNHHLRELNLSSNDMSEEFARERLLPAVRANTSLRTLYCHENPLRPAAEEAEELVCRRGQHS